VLDGGPDPQWEVGNFKRVKWRRILMYREYWPCGLLSNYFDHLFMVALCNRADHILYFHPVVCSLFSSPNVSGRRFDVYTSTHGVALVRI